MNIEHFNWRRIKPAQKLHKFLYFIGLGPIIGIIVLLLTTTGRKSGLKRVTPLQYEQIGGTYCVGAARGMKADWVRNIAADSHVDVQVKRLRFSGQAEIVNDPKRIADFLEVRLKHHPLMMGLLMEKAHNLPRRPSRTQLEELAATEVIVVLTPEKSKEKDQPVTCLEGSQNRQA